MFMPQSFPWRIVQRDYFSQGIPDWIATCAHVRCAKSAQRCLVGKFSDVDSTVTSGRFSPLRPGTSLPGAIFASRQQGEHESASPYTLGIFMLLMRHEHGPQLDLLLAMAPEWSAQRALLGWNDVSGLAIEAVLPVAESVLSVTS